MSSIDFDHVLRLVGDSGRYQTVMFIVLCIPATMPVAFIAFSNVFTCATPDHWCKSSPALGNLNVSASDLKHLTVPYRIRGDGEKIFSKCTMYDDDHMTYNVLIDEFLNKNDSQTSTSIGTFGESISDRAIPVVNCKYGWNYDNRYYDNTLVTQQNLVCDDGWFPQTTTVVFYVGSIFGNVFFGWIADRWGRRKAILWLITVEVITSILTCFSIDYKMYLTLRTFVGLVFPALYQVPFVLGIEMMGPKHRTMAGMIICVMFAISMSLLALLAFLFRDWYKLSMVTSIPFVLLFGYYWIIPESPRWLLSKGKLDEAERVLETIARFNGTTIPKKILHELHENDSVGEILLPISKPSRNGFIENKVEDHHDHREEIKYNNWKDNQLKQQNFGIEYSERDKNLNHSSKIALAPYEFRINNIIQSNDTLLEKSNVKPKIETISNQIPKAFQTSCFSSAIEFDTTEDQNVVKKNPVIERTALIDIFRYRNIRKKFFLLTFIWLANAVVYNGLSYNATNLGVNDFLAFFIVAVIEIPSNILAWCLMDIWGRRWVLCMAFTVGGLGCLCCMFVPEEFVWITVMFAMIGKFGIAASFSVFYVFVSESFPTVIRSRAMGFAGVVVSIGLLVFPYILQLEQVSRVLPMIILGLISLCAAAATIFLPETLNAPMPQTLEDGEKFGKDFKIFSIPKRKL